MDDDPRPVGELGVDGGGQGGRRVDHEQVARLEVVGEVAECGMNRLVVATRDHQPHLVTGEAARLGGCRRNVRVIELEVEWKPREGNERRCRLDGSRLDVCGFDALDALDAFDHGRGHGATCLAT